MSDSGEGVHQEGDPNCLFCKREITAGALAENGSVYSIGDAFPVTPGHVLVIPKRHTRDFFTMTPEELRDAEELLRVLKDRALREDPTITGFNVGANCGESARQTVAHAHIHLIPRRDGDTDEPRGGVRGVVPARRAH